MNTMGGILSKFRSLLSVVSGLAVVLSTGFIAGAPASAAAEPANAACNKAMVQNGECIFAAVKDGEDPVVAGVVNALELGYFPTSSIEKFIKTRGQHVQDASQHQVEKILREESTSERSTKSPEVTPMNAGGVGTVLGNTLDVSDVISIYVCPSSGGACLLQSKVDVEWRYSLWFGTSQESVLSGDFDVQTGYPSPIFDEVKCTTVHDGLFNVDSVVKDWNNCSIHSDPFRSKSFVQIQSSTWIGGDKGQVYHPQYDLVMELVTSYGWSGLMRLGWTGKEYEIKADGTSVWR